jgi:excisionase family DNA binding protein
VSPQRGSAASTPVEADSSAQNGAGVRLLSAEQVAERWGVPKSQVWHLARTEQVPCVRLGRYVRFREAAIDQWERDGGTGV